VFCLAQRWRLRGRDHGLSLKGREIHGARVVTLQRWILQKAATRGSLYYPEILAEYFGWEPRQPFHRLGEGNLSYWTDEKLQTFRYRPEQPVIWEGHQVGDMAGGGAQYFDRHVIGQAQYRQIMATLSRSVKRIEQRELVKYWMWGAGSAPHVRLTTKGREWLSVNTEHNVQC
jgi:hypothetical protein